MDWTSILVAVITALGSFVGVYYANRRSQSLIIYRLEQLEKTVGKHNNLESRIYRLEESQAVTDEKIKVVNHRLDDLEQKKGA